MIFSDAKTQGIQKEFAELESIMKGIGFVRWAWDYNKVTYDYLFTHDQVDYYLRVRATVIGKKQLEHPKALLTIGAPTFVRHFFPHGLDDSVDVPAEIEADVLQKIKEIEQALLA